MKQEFCAKCGALLGNKEYNFVEGVEGVVCDACCTAKEASEEAVEAFFGVERQLSAG